MGIPQPLVEKLPENFRKSLGKVTEVDLSWKDPKDNP